MTTAPGGVDGPESEPMDAGSVAAVVGAALRDVPDFPQPGVVF